MDGIKHLRQEDLPVKHHCHGEQYEYFRRSFVSRGEKMESLVCIYEVPPGKSPYPYHYHLKDEETFYIVSGQGVLKTPQGEKPVRAGDLLFFPPNEQGAHKLTNASDTENLVYIDMDVIHDLDVCIYPDSGKIGVWGKEVNRVYPVDAHVNYYQGE